LDIVPLAYLGKVGLADGGVEEDRIIEVAHIGNVVHEPARICESAVFQ
jgi:hypothetical protein